MEFTVNGAIQNPVDDNKILYYAASPPDFRTTYTGSGLPFANQEQAFYNTPNKGIIELNNGNFSIQLLYPNSYMVGLGTVTIPPTLYIEYLSNGKKEEVSIKLSEGLPYRMLTYPSIGRARSGPEFYNEDLPIRTQEQILRDSGYPGVNITPDNYWGLKPSH